MFSLIWPAPAWPPQEDDPSIMCLRHVVLLPQTADVCLSSVYPEQRRGTSLESTLVEVLILSTLTPFRMNTCRAKPHFAQFWCNVSPFRVNTCKSASKQTTLSTFRINTCEKTGGQGGRFWNSPPISQHWRYAQVLCFHTLAHSLAGSKTQLISFQSLPHSLHKNTGGGGRIAT